MLDFNQSGRRCICSAQHIFWALHMQRPAKFYKNTNSFLKIEILELKFRKNTVFFVKKKYKFWLSYFFSKIKLKKRFFCNSVGNLIFLGAAYTAPKKYAWRCICSAGAAYAAPTGLYILGMCQEHPVYPMGLSFFFSFLFLYAYEKNAMIPNMLIFCQYFE